MAKQTVKSTESKSEALSKVEAELKKRRSQRSFPASTLEEPLEFAKAIFRIGSGQPVRRFTLFDQLGKSPESGGSRQLIINSGKYGLTKGGVQAENIELTAEGLKAVDDQVNERDRAKIKAQLAITNIEPFQKLYDKFVGNKLPAHAVLIDAAKDVGIEPAHAAEAVDTFVVNLRFVGLLKTLSGAERIISNDMMLGDLPAAPANEMLRHAAVAASTSIVTSEHAQFESTCFYIAPIGEEGSEARKHSDLFLGTIVEPALEQFQLKVVRADAIDKPGVITRQIIEYIMRSRLVIADLSFRNPNVFYELALRHAVKLSIVQIIRASEKIPFDVNQMRTVVIDTTDIYAFAPRIDSYRSEVANQVRRALEPDHIVDTPISIYFPNMTVSL
ncbi:hypothetical protein HF263_20675 [Rhizobium leguminosarum]|jgi:hypothetical protein|uniref:hypothetical protein n=1 Tax=Rhizobium leguminosarum TaxID=384 RepID=UPI000FF35B73|nr:hypothetical protein [Rhizobium leguminosarum]MBY2992917.1 hypothetical protein [Rhizobium leguminosarum]MBY3058476.1 hypothetical protein [Rhizobium leguminosarum]RWY79290.1 hypothetical protein EHI46_00945 [Rhizobium leguminosarum]